MIRILGLFPLEGNGGIASWAQKYIATFSSDEYEMLSVNVSRRKGKRRDWLWHRIIYGILSLMHIIRNVKSALIHDNIDIVHATTSGSYGSYRDYLIGRLCKKYAIKCILHCHYGCITEDMQSKGLVGHLLRKALKEYDQIWVLDVRSYSTLNNIPYLRGKIRLTPNSIDVNENIDYNIKKFSRMAFIGNLIPSKGIYEVVEAATRCNIRLDIVGPGTEPVLTRIKRLSRDKLNKSIFIHGRLANSEAVKFMKEVDIVVLPTYYPSEAFPISILEAMSLTKMVITCPRAAIPDMLKDHDGNLCGILVKPRSVIDIVSAVNWCQQHINEANKICQDAYRKVYSAYRKEVVYELYIKCYSELL